MYLYHQSLFIFDNSKFSFSPEKSLDIGTNINTTRAKDVFARGANDGEEILVYFDRVEALCETQKRIILRKKSDSGTRVGGVLKDVKEDEDEGKEE